MADSQIVKRASSLEEMLETLTQFGRPRLHCHDNMTWSASLTLNTTAKSSDFEIKSGFGHPTPRSAAIALIGNLQDSIRSFAFSEQATRRLAHVAK